MSLQLWDNETILKLQIEQNRVYFDEICVVHFIRDWPIFTCLAVTLDDLTTIRESEKKSQLSPVFRQWSSLAIHPWSFLLFTRVRLFLRLRSLEKIGRDFCIIWWIMRVPGPKSPCPPTLRARGGARSQHDALLPSGSLEYFSFTGGGGGAGCYALDCTAA